MPTEIFGHFKMDIDDRHLCFLSMDIRLKDPYFVMAELDKYQQKIAALTEENAILTQSKSVLTQSYDDLSHEVKVLREKDSSSDKKLKRFKKRINVLYAEKLSLTEMVEDLERRAGFAPPPPVAHPSPSPQNSSPSQSTPNTDSLPLPASATLPLPAPAAPPLPPPPPHPEWKKVQRKNKRKNKKTPTQVNIGVNPNFKVNNPNGQSPFSRGRLPNVSKSIPQPASCPKAKAWEKMPNSSMPSVSALEIRVQYAVRNPTIFLMDEKKHTSVQNLFSTWSLYNDKFTDEERG